MRALWTWALDHRLHFLGVLLILTCPIVGYTAYAGLYTFASWLDWSFLAMIYMGALGFLVGGASGTYGFALILKGHHQLTGTHQYADSVQ